jgi:ribosomal protein S18 acetylase RimI-like enzyme
MTHRELPFEIEGVRYSICRPAEIPELARLIARSFSRHDPPAVVLGLTEADFEPYLATVTPTTGVAGLTVVARETASHEMAGALLAEDAYTPAQVDLAAVSPRFAPIYDLFGELEVAIGDTAPIEPGATLHVFMLGVDERFTRRGIAQHLVEACLANGAALGYRTAVTEATNRVSQHIFAKLGFVMRAEASYGEFRRDGVATFAAIEEHGGVMSMIRSISPGPSVS